MCVVIFNDFKMVSQFVSHEKSFVLIEMAQAEECLWDMRCASYHDCNRKRRVIEELSEKLELPGKYVLVILETTRFVVVQSPAIAGCHLIVSKT